jgi:hypothetical protein
VFPAWEGKVRVASHRKLLDVRPRFRPLVAQWLRCSARRQLARLVLQVEGDARVERLRQRGEHRHQVFLISLCR